MAERKRGTRKPLKRVGNNLIKMNKHEQQSKFEQKKVTPNKEKDYNSFNRSNEKLVKCQQHNNS